MDLITTSGELAEVCARMARHPFVTVDTEFLRETTYYPLLCVAQLASPDEAVVVDALAPGIDLGPLFALMTDENVVKVFHAARQDIEIVWNMAKKIPHPIFDSQVAAMVLGYGDSISYDQLVQRITGDQLDKSHRFTDWTRRPLSDAQVSYALSDVTHLRAVYLKLAADLAKRERTSWVEAEMNVLTSPETYRADPERAWERLKSRVRKPKELGVLIEIAAWREREAQTRDVPRSRVLKDDVVGDIAVQAPTTVERLGHLRSLPKGFERSRWGEAIIEAVKRGLERDPKTLPRLERFPPGAERRRHRRTAEGAAAHDRRAPRRRRQGDRHGRRTGPHRRRRRGRRAGAQRLAARTVRRQGARPQARATGARGRKRPRGGGGEELISLAGACLLRSCFKLAATESVLGC